MTEHSPSPDGPEVLPANHAGSVNRSRIEVRGFDCRIIAVAGDIDRLDELTDKAIAQIERLEASRRNDA